MQEALLAKAKEYGYEVKMRNSDKNWYGLFNDDNSINLELYIDTEEFELSYYEGFIKITTGKCGSFTNESHFRRVEDQLNSIIQKLKS